MTLLNVNPTTTGPDLTHLISPRSIALIGATDKQNSMGYQTFLNLAVESRFRGKLYPISSRLKTLGDHVCFPSIDSLPEAPDVAVIAIPAVSVIEAVRQCAEFGVKFGIIFTSGFGELGEEGILLQREMQEIANRSGMRLYGPNCPGLTNIAERVGMSFSPAFSDDLRVGPLGVVTQGGGLGRTLLQAGERGIGASVWASVGNAADLDVADFVSHFATDDDISVICALMEGINDGDKFISAARKATLNDKPLVVLKAGRSEVGKLASLSHTATLAGNSEINSAVFAELGVVEVDDTDELMDIAWLLSRARPGPRTRFAIFGSSGGAVTFTADFMAAAGLELSQLTDETLNRIRKILPDFVNVSNPVDVTAAVLHDKSLLVDALRAVVEDPAVDAVVLPIPITYGSRKAFQSEVFAKIQAEIDIPLIPIWMSDKRGIEWEMLTEAGLSSPRSLTKAISMLKRWVEFGRTREHVQSRSRGPFSPMNSQLTANTSSPALNLSGGLAMTEHSAKEWLRGNGIDVPQGVLVHSAEEASDAVGAGKEYVAKVSSPDILHKSDVGGVILGVDGRGSASEAFETINANIAIRAPRARIDGVLIEEQVPSEGLDFIIGVHRDDVFGRVLTVGIGGIYVEILDDVAHSLLPVDRPRAEYLLRQLKSWSMLTGVRGQGVLDISSLTHLIERVSTIISCYEEIDGLELNPVRVSSTGTIVLDVVLEISKLAGEDDDA